jgi:hypothetical protein
MKKTLCVVLLLGIGVAVGQGINKLWVKSEYEDPYIRAYFIQDLETGTRCYVVSGENDGNLAGHFVPAIS